MASLQHYSQELQIWSTHHFRVAPALVGRSGAVAVAGLALIPLAALAARRRWSAFVLAGSVAILALELVPTLFVHFSELVSLSQSRRAAGFIPFAFAFAGGLALLARTVLVLPAALAAGIALQLEWPGDFGYDLHHGGPAFATWWALFGTVAALVLALVSRRDLAPRFGAGALAAAAFTLPVLVHGATSWTPANPVDPNALSPRLVHSLRTKVPKGAVVIAPVTVSYEVEALAPVYVVAAPLTHVANTKANRALARFRAVKHRTLTDDPRVPKEFGATYQIRNGRLARVAGS
jgi:hypothetical protein